MSTQSVHGVISTIYSLTDYLITLSWQIFHHYALYLIPRLDLAISYYRIQTRPEELKLPMCTDLRTSVDFYQELIGLRSCMDS
jgi:hypothetical protein